MVRVVLLLLYFCNWHTSFDLGSFSGVILVLADSYWVSTDKAVNRLNRTYCMLYALAVTKLTA